MSDHDFPLPIGTRVTIDVEVQTYGGLSGTIVGYEGTPDTISEGYRITFDDTPKTTRVLGAPDGTRATERTAWGFAPEEVTPRRAQPRPYVPDREPGSYWGVLCPRDGSQGLSRAEYLAQLSRPDALWTCPLCGVAAQWDDPRYELGF